MRHFNSNINDVLKYFETKEIVGEITLVIKDKENNYKEFKKKKRANELIDAD